MQLKTVSGYSPWSEESLFFYFLLIYLFIPSRKATKSITKSRLSTCYNFSIVLLHALTKYN